MEPAMILFISTFLLLNYGSNFRNFINCFTSDLIEKHLFVQSYSCKNVQNNFETRYLDSRYTCTDL